jgi:hypothetical protein
MIRVFHKQQEGGGCPIAGLDSPCMGGFCMLGNCTAQPTNENAVCGDSGSPCLENTCTAGACTPKPANNGTVCAASDSPCLEHTCSAGACAPVTINVRFGLVEHCTNTFVAASLSSAQTPF